MDDVARCAGPYCSRPLPRAATGRARCTAGRTAARPPAGPASAPRKRQPPAPPGSPTPRPPPADCSARSRKPGSTPWPTSPRWYSPPPPTPSGPCAELDQAARDMLAQASELARLARRFGA